VPHDSLVGDGCIEDRDKLPDQATDRRSRHERTRTLLSMIL